MLLIKQFNQRFSVRKTDEFGKPRIIPLEKLQIPRGAVFHTIDLDQVVLAPPVSTPILQDLEKPAQIRHHFKLPEEGISGHPRNKPVQGQEKAIFQYHRVNRSFRRLSSDALVRKDLKTLLIENYTPMLSHYIYPDTQLAWYDRLRNIMVTMTNQFKYDTAEYLRQNYFVIELGSTLPSFNKFQTTFNDRVKTKLEKFHDFNLLWLLEIFAWAYGHQKDSLFDGMDITQLSRMNFIFTHNSGFTSMNMGLVEKMRKSSGGRLSDDQMGRNFYKSLVQVMTQAPSDEYEAEFLTPEGEERIVTRDEVEEDNVDLVDDNDDVDNEADVQDDNSFDEKEDLVIEAPKEDIKATTIVVEKHIAHDEVIKQEVKRLAEAGRVTSKAYQFLSDSSQRFVNLPNPYNPKETYGQALTIDVKDIEVKAKPKKIERLVTDEAWFENTNDQVISQYNKTMLPKDVLSAVASTQRLGLAIHNHTVEKENTVTGKVEHHTLRIQPIGGEPTTIRFSIPSLTEDGTWVANGVEYTMRKQRVDLPIRKVAPDTVALTTAYGKNFVRRSDKVVNDYGRWLTNAIITRAVDPKNTEVTDAKLANVFDPLLTLPRQYTEVARRVATFNAMGYMWSFDYKMRDTFFDSDQIADADRAKLIPVAKKARSEIILCMDDKSQMYKVKEDQVEPLGTLAEMLGVDESKAPREMTELSLMGKSVSLGFIFSFYLGLQGALKHFGIQYELVPAGQRVGKSQYDSIIRLQDAKILVNCDNDQQRMILNGLDRYLKHLTAYTESEVEREDIYLNLLRDADGLTPRYIKELKQMRTAFVDDMHARILRKMGEPETFIGLLERSNEMLQTDQTLPEINGEEMMFIGNQRIAYHIYTAMVRAMRNYNNAPGANRKFELTQDMIWGAINSDPSVLLAPGANPIQSIKEKDVVTMGGTGGRNRKTMVYHTREFQPSDLGIVSGNTVDNGDVGITAFLTNNPAFDTIDGTTYKRKDELKPGEALSFIDGLVPDTLMDDAKRQNFVGIQMGSATSCIGATTTPYRTEQEKAVAHRTSVKHARVIDKAGKITGISDDHIEITYEDGEKEAFPLGRWFGAHEGTYYPHTLVTRWKAGDKLPAGTVITYNDQHFEVDIYDPTQVSWKNGILATVALPEGEEVIEDSNAISERFASKAQSDVTKLKEVTITFTQNLLEIGKEGDHVDVDSILCTFTDNLTGDMSGFSKEAAATLQDLSSFAPRAGVRGHIDKIEVVYHGETEDMTPSLAELVRKYDRIRRKAALAVNRDDPTDGRVTGDYRVEGVPLAYNSLCVRFYITHRVDMAAADKMVIANQLKTTVQEVMRGVNRTESGDDIDILFGRDSVDARIVGSIQRIGTANAVGERAGILIGDILDGKDVPVLPTKL
ncbi:RNA polymerase beta subunit [Erwinia phage phiEaH2]|uniref:Putative phage DNA-directed RNA polymerase beta subunit 2 n=1 Tax=Erwinia phage phiEaH2 TaxID=1029988 RepID=J7KCD7_9CAUD|nr:RNA polymerase beta subunit [Erwinia phage phiEaH2]AFQ96706.1 putative phage DNA-directed RNA polymerase beta subunit 2 [Erwinia phage phiEaH2]